MGYGTAKHLFSSDTEHRTWQRTSINLPGRQNEQRMNRGESYQNYKKVDCLLIRTKHLLTCFIPQSFSCPATTSKLLEDLMEVATRYQATASKSVLFRWRITGGGRRVSSPWGTPDWATSWETQTTRWSSSLPTTFPLSSKRQGKGCFNLFIKW